MEVTYVPLTFFKRVSLIVSGFGNQIYFNHAYFNDYFCKNKDMNISYAQRHIPFKTKLSIEN